MDECGAWDERSWWSMLDLYVFGSGGVGGEGGERMRGCVWALPILWEQGECCMSVCVLVAVVWVVWVV